MNGYEKLVKEQLAAHGWRHEIWSNGRRKVAVNKTCKSRHTANDILKQAGVAYRF